MGRKQFICHTELPYNITGRSINREWFASEMPEVWAITSMHLHFMSFAFNVQIHAFLLMSNHFHLIATAPEGNLSEAMRIFMSETGRDLRSHSGRINRVYGSRFHRTLISNENSFLNAYKYLYYNPVKAGICEKVEEYPYSTLPGLLGKTRVEVPVLSDENWSTVQAREQNLDWINQKPDDLEWELVRKALRKHEFKIARHNGRRSRLESERL